MMDAREEFALCVKGDSTMHTTIKTLSKIKPKDRILANFNSNDLYDLYHMLNYFDEETQLEWHKAIKTLMDWSDS